MPSNKPVQVLHSFPHKLGADRLCYGAWQQVNSLAAAGADVLCYPGVLYRPVPPAVRVRPTLSRGKLRVSYKLLGKMRALALHDRIVARRLQKLLGQIDIIHTWPSGALQTLKAAKRLGIPTVLERTNAHTRFAFDVVKQESERLGITLPSHDEYFYRADVLEREEEEFAAADYLLCPSDFVVKTFLDRGFPPEKLLRHIYGVDESTFYPGSAPRDLKRPFTMLFVGVAAVRKGVHFALEAWLKSPASRDGRFLIVGDFLPAYAERLSSMLSHQSVHVLGHIEDVPGAMRTSDIFVMPSIEEGFARVVTEAMASGCVPLASEACTEICKHMDTGLVHRVGDVPALSEQITMLYEDRALLARLRTNGLGKLSEITWYASGLRLIDAYREAISGKRQIPQVEVSAVR